VDTPLSRRHSPSTGVGISGWGTQPALRSRSELPRRIAARVASGYQQVVRPSKAGIPYWSVHLSLAPTLHQGRTASAMESFGEPTCFQRCFDRSHPARGASIVGYRSGSDNSRLISARGLVARPWNTCRSTGRTWRNWAGFEMQFSSYAWLRGRNRITLVDSAGRDGEVVVSGAPRQYPVSCLR
jgi:hypothetical protein